MEALICNLGKMQFNSDSLFWSISYYSNSDYILYKTVPSKNAFYGKNRYFSQKIFFPKLALEHKDTKRIIAFSFSLTFPFTILGNYS